MIRKFISIILSLSMILSFGTLVFAAENNQNEEQFMVGRDSDTKELFIEEINGLANEDIQGTVVEKNRIYLHIQYLMNRSGDQL